MIRVLLKTLKRLLHKVDDNRLPQSMLGKDVATTQEPIMPIANNISIGGPIDIYTTEELTSVVLGNVVNHSIVIRDGAVNSLTPIIYIKGTLGLSDCKIETLYPLKEIGSDVWCSFYNRKPILKTLGSLQKVRRDANFRYMPLEDLGDLEYVGGNLSLRDTNIANLGKLRYVGGNLYLPKRLENKIDLKDVSVGGKIRFWNDIRVARSYKNECSEDDLLLKSKVLVPAWPHTYIYPQYDISQESEDIRRFYEYFKSLFHKGVLLNVEGYLNYCFLLMYDLQKQYQNPIELAEKYHILSRGYPKVANYCDEILIGLYESNHLYDRAWDIEKKNTTLTSKLLSFYMDKVGAHIFTAYIAVKICGAGCLTSLGLSKLEDISPFFMQCLKDFEEERGCNFYDVFYDKGLAYKSINNGYDSEYYKQFFQQDEACFSFYDEIDNDSYHSQHRDSFLVVENAIKCQLRVLLIKAENAYRESIGMPLPKTGEGWISETNLFYQIRNHYKDYEVVQHGRPQWLGRQHLDIYFPNENIGIEYQGVQHYQPVDYFGGEEGFARNQERDERKRKLCKKHSCSLIYVDEGYDIQDVIKCVDNALKKNA